MNEKLSEEELIEYVKPILKANGFKKKGKRWTRTDAQFTRVFFIQGSCFDKDDYYIRPGIFFNDLIGKTNDYYGNIMKQIPITTPDDIISKCFEFFDEWTNMDYIRKMLLSFIEWDERNPLEKRRAGQVNYEIDPPPTWLLFSLNAEVKKYILEFNHT